MKFGLCTTVEHAAALQQAGWDFLEESVQSLLQGEVPGSEWSGGSRARQAPLFIPSANMFVPAKLKITGAQVNSQALRKYCDTVLSRAKEVGIRTIVFGSGGARHVPDGFDRARAKAQVIDFATMAARLAQQHDVMIVIEPLNRSECNIINTVSEAMQYVREINHPNLQCLVDSYHLWLEEEPLENVKQAMPWIRHVHVADKDGRVPPGESGSSDYRPLFRILKDAQYAALISVEAKVKDLPADSARILSFLRKEWEGA
jgi:sugar phosphate isomerase/epimerase